ncbi:hypothetical protein GCM10010347_42570 [Streptomyces cirratus]|uniref:Uncharacterized protein n=1 Tax=Streptomyces cirratus TaxID=68187 RepID=A0ABQ3F063_9ACTN|nr:hypothetical protein GCM10010347_42570 [Streptomyces cirratus]
MTYHTPAPAAPPTASVPAATTAAVFVVTAPPSFANIPEPMPNALPALPLPGPHAHARAHPHARTRAPPAHAERGHCSAADRAVHRAEQDRFSWYTPGWGLRRHHPDRGGREIAAWGPAGEDRHGGRRRAESGNGDPETGIRNR